MVKVEPAPSLLPDSPAQDKEDLEDEFSDLEEEPSLEFVERAQKTIETFYASHRTLILRTIGLLALLALHAWLVVGLAQSVGGALGLLVLVLLGWALAAYALLLKPRYGTRIADAAQPGLDWVGDGLQRPYVRIGLGVLVLVFLVVFLAVDTASDRNRLRPLLGIGCFLSFLFLFSKNPSRVKWRPVLWGIGIQLVMGFAVLRWETGASAFKWSAAQIVVFLDYTKNGTSFVWGFLAAPPPVCGFNGVFAFTVLQVVIYFGSIVAVLYYLGVMQFVLTRLAWLMQMSLGTTAAESLNAVACIFLGQSEAPLLIQPYLHKMSMSELHAVMTVGYACVAGSLFAAYISFGANPQYILSATVMNAPGALALSKLFCPETKKSKLKRIEDLHLPKGEENNVIECISNGAVGTVHLVWAICANLVVFLALLAFVNEIIVWLGAMVGWDVDFTSLMGFLFFPVAWVLTHILRRKEDSMVVAQIIGTKTILNEFIAYEALGKKVIAGEIGLRGQLLATYALCGFSNLSSIGIQLGILGGMCPEKKSLLSSIAVRALVAGMITNFTTACIAGTSFSNLSSIGIQLGILGGMCPEKKSLLSSIAVRALVAGMITNFTTACIAGTSFSNLSSIGIQLGILGGMCPEKKSLLSSIAVRALVAGMITNFTTACIAGTSFSNLSSIGIQLGILGGMCPEKKSLLSSIAVRALVAGMITNFTTACIAGTSFSNLSSIGIQLGILGGMCPEKKSLLSSIAVRALVAGMITNFTTACIAGTSFSNLSSIGIQLGILGGMCPEKKSLLSSIAVRALVAGMITNFTTACIAGTSFSNLSSIGIQLGILGGMCPEKKSLLSSIAVRALVAGMITNFTTACIAGTSFSNLSSIGIQLGILGGMCPEKKSLLSSIAVRALVAGMITNFTTACIAGTSFSNLSSIGIQLGILGGMCPEKKSLLSSIAVRALVAGMITNFTTACIAGTSFSNLSSIGIQLGILGGMCPEKKSLLSSIAVRALVAGMITNFTTACIAGTSFSNLSSIGIQLGILGGMCPEKKSLLSSIAVRALVAGMITNFTTACIAGILVDAPAAFGSGASGGGCMAVVVPNATLLNATASALLSTMAGKTEL